MVATLNACFYVACCSFCRVESPGRVQGVVFGYRVPRNENSVTLACGSRGQRQIIGRMAVRAACLPACRLAAC
jgi:hypothetical protein